jgi:hypothetical protein
MQLALLEDELLSSSPYWHDWITKESEPRQSIGAHTFSIADSLRGGRRGDNSDQKYDNKSEIQSLKKFSESLSI